MTSAEDIKKSIKFIESPKNTVAYTIKDGANGDRRIIYITIRKNLKFLNNSVK